MGGVGDATKFGGIPGIAQGIPVSRTLIGASDDDAPFRMSDGLAPCSRCARPQSEPHPPLRNQSHDGAALGLVLAQVRGHGCQVGPGRHVRDPLGAARRLAALYAFAALVDARQRGHVEDVTHAVLRLLRRALDVGRRDLLGHAGTLQRERLQMNKSVNEKMPIWILGFPGFKGLSILIRGTYGT